ncbi:MAG: hypothetical protein H6585_06820 [Flavobacteriales bacterium]|nr:hypothetical protein [Flavobacteriales bacterium]MCB9448043.1 hypothetical protein [Flavobacteriales bacterium]
MKAIRYIRTAIFTLAALGMVDFMTRTGLDAAGRYSYSDFNNHALSRTLADVLLLTAFIFLAARQWMQKGRDPLYGMASLIFILLLIPNIGTWLYLTNVSPIYPYILTVFSLPILIILHDLSAARHINFKFPLIAGLFFIASGFVYDIACINLPFQDPTPEIINKRISQQKTLYWLYYIGMLLMTTGVLQRMTRKLKTA